MTIDMRLHDRPFRRLQSGEKTVEIRLYDEKRRTINLGDEIQFTHIDTGKNLFYTVTGLSIFPDFRTLFHTLLHLFPYREGQSAEDFADAMNEYYSKEDERKYGVVGIHLASTNSSHDA